MLQKESVSMESMIEGEDDPNIYLLQQNEKKKVRGDTTGGHIQRRTLEAERHFEDRKKKCSKESYESDYFDSNTLFSSSTSKSNGHT